MTTRSDFFDRRHFLKLSFGTVAASRYAFAKAPVEPKPVAGVVTVYHPNSHADVLLGKILTGWRHDGGPGPALKLASLYVDQFPENDLARKLCEKQGVPLFDSIEKAITLGGKQVAVDGVLSIGEHGDYGTNDVGQYLYPRRRFFSEIAAALEKCGRIVPVFNDKHLGPVWNDAQWMYDRAKKLNIPFMAGSSMPVGWRHQEIELPLDSDIEQAVGIGYSGLEPYGFHALEFFQSHVERRKGGETGVKSVRFVQGDAVWKLVDDGTISQAILDAALAVVPKPGAANPRQDPQARLMLFEYQDGFRGAVFMLTCVAGTATAVKLRRQAAPLATAFDERIEPRFPHFAYQLKAIERMIHTGKPSYPVERTYLTSGILDRIMNSRAKQGQTLLTPELAISYQPVLYPHAPHVDLLAQP